MPQDCIFAVYNRRNPPKPAKKERTCLRCIKAFMSDGPQNRICQACKAAPPPETGTLFDRYYLVNMG